MNQLTIILHGDMYFSYSQFAVYNDSVETLAHDITQAHVDQGFARRENFVAVFTLLEYGTANVTVRVCPYEHREEYQRVVAVPFLVEAGMVLMHGPDETGQVDRNLALHPGNYRLVVAQYATSDDEEVIDLYFEPLTEALERSAVLLADEALNPPTPLVETVDPLD